jgi:hypothetical protein
MVLLQYIMSFVQALLEGEQDTFKSGPGSKKVKKGPVSNKRENFYIKFSIKIIFFLKK